MLTREENELLCRVGAATPMGQMLRRYWIPAVLSQDLVTGGAPRRLRLLGDDLVAFRDSTGHIGILDEACPHRGASLVLARNEDCGLTCIYHGWQIGADGRILSTPAEPEESDFRQRIQHRSYLVKEVAGTVWAYLGPVGSEPVFPHYDWMALPPAQLDVMLVPEECNWVQALEGVVDSAHSNYLHSDYIRPSQAESQPNGASRYVGDQNPDQSLKRPSNDGRPRLEVQNTAYGFRYAAIRKPVLDADRYKYVRTTLFVAPFTAFVPAPEGWRFMQSFVPVDDEHSMLFFAQANFDEPVDHERLLEIAGARPGTDLDATGHKIRRRENTWLQDRELMRRGRFSGLQGVQTQDMAVQESMAPIYDRRREHLGSSDMAVIRFRRLMLDAALGMQAGGPPLGLSEPVSYNTLRAEEKIIHIDTPWQSVGAFAGEPMEDTAPVR